jgi:hypothetical protein
MEPTLEPPRRRRLLDELRPQPRDVRVGHDRLRSVGTRAGVAQQKREPPMPPGRGLSVLQIAHHEIEELAPDVARDQSVVL